jgi:hypothetical protein
MLWEIRTINQAVAGTRLGDYAADDCDYEDHHSDQEQSTDDLFAQGAAAMIAVRIVFGGSHFNPTFHSDQTRSQQLQTALDFQRELSLKQGRP